MTKSRFSSVHIIEVPQACGPEVVAALSGGNLLGKLPEKWPLGVTRESAGKTKKIKRISGDSLTVLFVRNPWSRVIAEIRDIQSRSRGIFPYLKMKKNIRQYVEKSLQIRQSDLRSQVDILRGTKPFQIDFIGRVESLRGDLEILADLLDLPQIELPDAPKLERTGECYRDFYDAESREWVAELYADDLAAFGYQFESSLEPEKPSPMRGDEIARALERGEQARQVRRDRGKELAGRYAGGAKVAWYLRSFHLWKRAFASGEARKILEVGSGVGISACVLLDGLFPHPRSEIHCIDPLGDDDSLEEFFWRNIEDGDHAERVELYRGRSAEILAWMIAGEGYWESFDLIIVDASPLARDVLSDACKSFDLLKPGGRMIFGHFADGGEAHPELAVEAFCQIYASVMTISEIGGLVIVEKRFPGEEEDQELLPELLEKSKDASA